MNPKFILSFQYHLLAKSTQCPSLEDSCEDGTIEKDPQGCCDVCVRTEPPPPKLSKTIFHLINLAIFNLRFG